MKLLQTLCGAFALSAVCQCVVAQEVALADDLGSREATAARFVPAELSFAGAQTIADVIRFPDTQGDVTVALHCALRVQSRNILSNFCFTPDRSTSAFEEAFKALIPRLRVSSARLDGRRETVRIPYSVEFIKRGDDERVRVYENHGAEVARYGRQYTAPQRVLSSVERVSRACVTSEPDNLVWVRANVTADGKPEGVRVVTDTSEACRETIEALFAQSSYIPAHYQGKPVAAEVLEPFFPALQAYGRCNARTHNIPGQFPLHGLQEWNGSRPSPCYWDRDTWHKIS